MCPYAAMMNWKTLKALGAELGVKDEAMRKWEERGSVPHRWRIPMINLARAKRVKSPTVFEAA